MGCVGGKFQNVLLHGHVQGTQASIQLIKSIKYPGSLLWFLVAPLWLDGFEPKGCSNYLGLTRYA